LENPFEYQIKEDKIDPIDEAELSIFENKEEEIRYDNLIFLQNPKDISTTSLVLPSFAYAKVPIIEEQPKKLLNSSKFIIEYSELTFDQEIGRGNFGAVFKGTWRGGEVAIKLLLEKENLTEKEYEEFRSEAFLMCNLRPHVNVVQFLGMTVAPNPQCIVSEFLNGGSLASLLKSSKEISTKMLFDIVFGIAAGMLHLHKEGIVHRDLAARNVLLTQRNQVKISDFGMSRKIKSDIGGKTKTETGPLKWMAIECLYDKKYSPKSDSWSFGITLYEIITRGEPYPNMQHVEAALAVYNGYKLSPPEYCPPIIAEIMRSCLQSKPEDRPDFVAITNYLREVPMIYWEKPI